MTLPRHLYLHIPFCQRRCSYCDFNTYANMEDRIERYVQALSQSQFSAENSAARSLSTPAHHPVLDSLADTDTEASDFQNTASASLLSSHSVLIPHRSVLTRSSLRDTVFLGGGTPTMLSLPQMEHVLIAADRLVPLATAEVTTEANPGTVIDEGYLRGLRDLGINRISFGVQSLHDPTLRVLGRIHTAAEAIATYEQARRAGFERINLDFIFGLPGQTLEQWAWTLDHAVELGADHFSLYSLIVEEDTPLHQQVTRGSITVPDDDATAAMYELAIEKLGAGGYVQYEISNWARADHGGPRPSFAAHHLGLPAQACQHNVAYWLNADYLAFGAGAHGHRYPHRWHDLRGVDAYIQAVQTSGHAVAETLDLSPADLYGETMMMGLRLNLGVSYAHFADRCGVDIHSVYGSTIAALVAQGLLVADTDGLRLTEHGRMLGNQVFARFLINEE